ncbi:DUF423 domain-containing protein [Myroides pelagicus]|uniref:DUF423 domain-containing protein n=1 Tax=Myroides pelagicus TaxID=270914 RepID=A0A7K1GJ75_9FLAO|nr:DUF423 domain-containing protein [Myroides pelagicus]MEC4113052.1 DUF423 domain-containing protein [Myroides pelagicus]MTH28945.1 DUF423 domain-containing protein [Myroides pelagicus]
MARRVLAIATLIGALGIVLGAFGAHGLKKIVTETQVATFEIGVRYLMYHVFFLLFIGMSTMFTDKAKKVIMYLVLLGMLFFSGSIFLLTFKDILPLKVSVIGPITPLGGVLFISAWLYACITVFKTKKSIK